ncbi:hypothetical protein [Lewinella sp. W8]|uniref:hypothetical protein n=1 Tax=Lewinella sp. W8 TaxID=2528208 RepID=UPI001067E839|nr:hypothetical protein [Lewinella sp. W8]MTB51258.1 hypothetical protein [Lewinella sp. W8]
MINPVSNVWYTPRGVFSSQSGQEAEWKKYIKWSKLTHLSEVVSLDGLLNKILMNIDSDHETIWKYLVVEGQVVTPFFTSLEYVIESTKDFLPFNLLAVIRDPSQRRAHLDHDFEFIGYDLIDKDFQISALVNCGGFDESFQPDDLNQFGLISQWGNARIIQAKLRKLNPEEFHADCEMFEVWRHKTIGRIK